MLTIATYAAYFALIFLTVAHVIWAVWKSSDWLKQSAKIENAAALRFLIEKKIKYYFRQSGLGFLFLFIIASVNAWVATQQITFNQSLNRVLKLLCGLGIKEGFFARLGVLGLYWGFIIITFAILGEKARSQLQMLWILRKDLSLEMPGYYIREKTVGVSTLIAFIIIIILLLGFLLFFPYFL